MQQIIKNLLSNAFKFTHHGQVTLTVEPATQRLEPRQRRRSIARRAVLAFSVSDTGIGIPADKQQIIFEAFQQADGSTSRKYGGTGLGLAISREIARLLGGEIRLMSAPGAGSTFTLYPAADLHAAQSAPRKSASTAADAASSGARRHVLEPAAGAVRRGVRRPWTKSATIATRSNPATACC